MNSLKKKQTKGQKQFEEFIKGSREYGLCPPPMTAEQALEILRLHFAKDYFCVMPLPHEQFTTELISHIIYTFKGVRG